MNKDPRILPTPPSSTQYVLREILAERQRQDQKWGEQNHPALGGIDPDHMRRVYAENADHYKGENDQRVDTGKLGWDGILLEEVYEAFAEQDPRKIREEMIQVCAVACAVIESLDRNELGGGA